MNLDDYLLDKLVSGVKDQDLKRRLIPNHELTFQIALDEPCLAELATLSLAELPQEQRPPKAREPAAINEMKPLILNLDNEGSVYRLSEMSNKSAGSGYMRGPKLNA